MDAWCLIYLNMRKKMNECNGIKLLSIMIGIRFFFRWTLRRHQTKKACWKIVDFFDGSMIVPAINLQFLCSGIRHCDPLKITVVNLCALSMSIAWNHEICKYVHIHLPYCLRLCLAIYLPIHPPTCIICTLHVYICLCRQYIYPYVYKSIYTSIIYLYTYLYIYLDIYTSIHLIYLSIYLYIYII